MPLGPLDMIQGATKRVSLAITTTVDGTTFVPADLTGCTAKMMVRLSYGATTPLLTLTTPMVLTWDVDSQAYVLIPGPGGLVIDTTAGTITFTITADQSASFPLSYTAPAASAFNAGSTASGSDPSIVLPFDVKITYPSGDVWILDDPVDTPFALSVYGAVTR